MAEESRLSEVVEVGENGELILPERLRDYLDIEPPALLVFEASDSGVSVSRAGSVEEFRGTVESDRTAQEMLEESRSLDRGREERLLNRSSKPNDQ